MTYNPRLDLPPREWNKYRNSCFSWRKNPNCLVWTPVESHKNVTFTSVHDVMQKRLYLPGRNHQILPASHCLNFCTLKKHLMKAPGHSIHSIVHIVSPFSHDRVKNLPRQPSQGGIGWSILQCFIVRLRNGARNKGVLQPSEVNIFWIFGRLNCLDKNFKARNLTTVVSKNENRMEWVKDEISLTVDKISLSCRDPDFPYH